MPPFDSITPLAPAFSRRPHQFAACLLGWALLGSMLGSLSACAAEPVVAPPSGPLLLTRVNELIGGAACQADSDCRTVAIGHKSCGGPEGYLPWSIQGTDAGALTRAAADYNAWRQAAQAADGRVSNCQFVSDPGAACAPAKGAAAGVKTCQLLTAPGRPGLQSR